MIVLTKNQPSGLKKETIKFCDREIEANFFCNQAVDEELNSVSDLLQWLGAGDFRWRLLCIEIRCEGRRIEICDREIEAIFSLTRQ